MARSRALQFDESGRRAITASVDGTARVWDPQSDPELAFLGRHDGSVNDVAVDSTGALVASAGEDGRARLWNLHRSPGPVFEGGAPLSALAFAPEDLLVAARKDGVVRVWSLRTRATVRSLDHGSPVHDVAVSLDGTIATAGEDGIVRLWNADGKPGLQIRHDAPVAAVAFSPDGSLLATASGTVVRLWSVSDGHRTKELRAHTNDVLSVAFDAGGKLLVTASVDHDARVWDLARATTVKTFSGHAGEVTDAALQPRRKLGRHRRSEPGGSLGAGASWPPRRPARISAGAHETADGRRLCSGEPADRDWKRRRHGANVRLPPLRRPRRARDDGQAAAACVGPPDPWLSARQRHGGIGADRVIARSRRGRDES